MAKRKNNGRGNLLVVDFDYFFVNPMEAEILTDDIGLYDWSHKEALFWTTILWYDRAASFIMKNKPLPQVAGWENFSERFRLSQDATLWFADSNAHAGLLGMDEPYESVWLYDAHHDCFTKDRNYWDWVCDYVKNNYQFSCEDWMLVHKLRGTELHWRFPQWHQYLRTKGPGLSLAAGVDLDYAVDGEEPVDIEFRDVFVCRSGAWVPPWCDGDFAKFLNTWDVAEQIQMDVDNESGVPIRDWQPETAHAMAEHFKSLMAARDVDVR